MIKKLTLKFGSVPDSTPLTIETNPITVFVGPNNSGKSKILSEIDNYCQSGRIDNRNVILDRVEFQDIAQDVASEMIRKITLKPNTNETIQPGHIIVGKAGRRMQVNNEQLINAVQNPTSQSNQFCPWFLAYYTLFLGGSNRINLINQQSGGDLQQNPTSSFQVLFKDNAKRNEVRRITHEAFGTYTVVDPTNLGNLRLRQSSSQPENEVQEIGIHSEAREFHSNAIPIENTSDGVSSPRK